jgi:DNA-binding MarR family transcriptional regulator
VLDRLQEADFLERRRHPADGRSNQVCLTEWGRDLAAVLTTIKERANVEFLSGLTPEEEMILSALLNKLG